MVEDNRLLFVSKSLTLYQPSKQLDTAISQSALLLVLMTVAGLGIGYATSIGVARILGPEGFEKYSVAIATLGLLSSIAEIGVGKFALRAIPQYATDKQWSLSSGFVRFAVGACLLVSVTITFATFVGSWFFDKESGIDSLNVAILFLPAMALTGVLIDFVIANHAAITGTFIARVFIPATTLTLIVVSVFAAAEVTSTTVVACYGLGSVAGLLLTSMAFRRTSPVELFRSRPEYQRLRWISESLNFAISAFLLTWILRISVIVMEALPISDRNVAYFVAALETGCLILLLAKSTDKFFQPQVSVILQKRSWDVGYKLSNKRRLFIGLGCVVFMSIIILFGKSILSLYGEEFQQGYLALCFVSLGACAWAMSSLSSSYLRFVGRHAFVTTTELVSAILMAIFTVSLGWQFEETGAGMAFCIVISLMSATFMISATRDYKKRQAQTLESLEN